MKLTDDERKKRKSEQAKAYYARHRERILEKNRKYLEANRQKHNDSQLRWYRTNREFVKNNVLMKRYGITLDEYNRILKQQDGHCAICSSSEQLHVDHDHETGKVRGILCQHCNRGLGMFKDSIESLQKAREYLEKA